MVTLVGEASDDTGRQMKVADVDGDGVDDLWVATLYADRSSGGGWVYPGGVLASGELDTVGWRVESDPYNLGAGRSLGAGDVDGDGVGDLTIGAPYPTDNGLRVLLGPIDADKEVSDGISLVAPASTFGGHGSDVGDLNGDGRDDVLMGSAYSSADEGAAYVYLGPASGDLDTSMADIWVVGASGDMLGQDLVAADLDGDGDGEVVVGGYGASRGAWIFADLTAGAYTTTDATTFMASLSSGDQTGAAVQVGDLDADGLLEVILGAPGESTNGAGAGAVYIVEASE